MARVAERHQEFTFGSQPILDVASVLASAGDEQLVGPPLNFASEDFRHWNMVARVIGVLITPASSGRFGHRTHARSPRK